MRWRFYPLARRGSTGPDGAAVSERMAERALFPNRPLGASPAYNPDDEPAPLGDVHRRGAAAERLLNDPTLAEACKEIREDLYSEWMFTKPEQTRRREELYYEAHAINEITIKLIAYRTAARIRRDTAA